MGDIDHDMAADKDQKWLKVTAPAWAYLPPTNSPIIHIEWGTGWYF